MLLDLQLLGKPDANGNALVVESRTHAGVQEANRKPGEWWAKAKECALSTGPKFQRAFAQIPLSDGWLRSTTGRGVSFGSGGKLASFVDKTRVASALTLAFSLVWRGSPLSRCCLKRPPHIPSTAGPHLRRNTRHRWRQWAHPRYKNSRAPCLLGLRLRKKTRRRRLAGQAAPLGGNRGELEAPVRFAKRRQGFVSS